MSAVVSGLVAAIVVLALTTLAERTQRSAKRLPNGWRTLRPSWLVHGYIILLSGMAGLIGYLLLHGGSARADASIQNVLAGLLLTAAVGGALHTAATCYFRTIVWKGNDLRARSILGRETVRRFGDVAAVVKGNTSGGYHVTFRDGSRLWFSQHMHGAKDLAARLPKRAFAG